MKGYIGDAGLLAPVDHFFHTMAEIPRLRQRVECIQITFQFDELAVDLTRKVGILKAAANEITGSRWFEKLLEVVLVVGNFMNASSTRGRAAAFEIDDLLKLPTLKGSTDVSYSLLNFCVSCMDANFPEFKLDKESTFDLSLEFGNLDLASRMSLSALTTEFAHLNLKLKTIQREVEIQKASSLDVQPPDPFIETLSNFAARSIENMAALQDDFSRCDEALKNAMKRYAQPGEDPETVLFGTLIKFREMYVEAAKQNLKVRAKQEKSDVADRFLGRKSSTRDMSNPKEQTAGEGDNLFLKYQNSMQASAHDMIAEFKAKIGKRRSEIELADCDDDSDDEWSSTRRSGSMSGSSASAGRPMSYP